MICKYSVDCLIIVIARPRRIIGQFFSPLTSSTGNYLHTVYRRKFFKLARFAHCFVTNQGFAPIFLQCIFSNQASFMLQSLIFTTMLQGANK